VLSRPGIVSLFKGLFACAAVASVAVACTAAPAGSEEPLPLDEALPPRKTEPAPPPDLQPQPEDQTVVPPCKDECDNESERRCAADGGAGGFEVCLRGSAGCLGWVAAKCAAGATCTPSTQTACFGACPPAGREACTQLGVKRCAAGGKLQTCTAEGGCPVWKETADCGAEGKICDGSACVTQCTSNCNAAGEKRCVAGTNNYETCTQVQPGCLRWQGATGCGSTKICTGAGSCVCNHECSTGSNTCVSPTTFKGCTTNAAGCRVRTAEKPCTRSLPSPGCFAYGAACFGTCNDQCATEGSITCTSPYTYQKCTRGSDQCRVLTTGSCYSGSGVCFASPTTCANGG